MRAWSTGPHGAGALREQTTAAGDLLHAYVLGAGGDAARIYGGVQHLAQQGSAYDLGTVKLSPTVAYLLGTCRA